MASLHRVSQDALCSAVTTIAFLRVLVRESEAWLVVGRAMLQPFL